VGHTDLLSVFSRGPITDWSIVGLRGKFASMKAGENITDVERMCNLFEIMCIGD
jgi:hypothetical protein